jgi:hypothetical protein
MVLPPRPRGGRAALTRRETDESRLREARLNVANETIIDDWTDHSATWDSGSISLGEGVHSLILEFYENGGDAVIQLEYQGPGIPQQTIPPGVLAHVP